ncbi:glycosyl transferase family 2 [Candidatus Pacearchaeota archaeon]|nr:glycosyl transferase family 2 [Candidatus Pacearchaeota archaeon]
MVKKVNIVIPMAGHGQRFVDAGYTTPKPLLKVGDKEIIGHIIENMRVPNAQFIFIVREDHCNEYELDKKLLEFEPNAIIVKINEVTQGSVCTVLTAKEHFDNDEPVIIKDCDEVTNWNPVHFFEYVNRHRADGAIVTIHSDKPSFSFSRVNSKGHIYETAEKTVISNHGSVGIYYFARGSDLIKYAQKMIDKNIRVNNEFYTAPVYNQFIQDLKIILNYPVVEMFGLGTPEEFLDNRNKFLEFLESKNIS